MHDYNKSSLTQEDILISLRAALENSKNCNGSKLPGAETTGFAVCRQANRSGDYTLPADKMPSEPYRLLSEVPLEPAPKKVKLVMKAAAAPIPGMPPADLEGNRI